MDIHAVFEGHVPDFEHSRYNPGTLNGVVSSLSG